MGTVDGMIFIFDNNLSKIMRLQRHEFIVSGLAFTRNDTYILSASLDYSVYSTKIKKSSHFVYYTLILVIIIVIAANLIKYFC